MTKNKVPTLLSKKEFSKLTSTQKIIIISEFASGIGSYRTGLNTAVYICSIFDFCVEVYISETKNEITKITPL